MSIKVCSSTGHEIMCGCVPRGGGIQTTNDFIYNSFRVLRDCMPRFQIPGIQYEFVIAPASCDIQTWIDNMNTLGADNPSQERYYYRLGTIDSDTKQVELHDDEIESMFHSLARFSFGFLMYCNVSVEHLVGCCHGSV